MSIVGIMQQHGVFLFFGMAAAVNGSDDGGSIPVFS